MKRYATCRDCLKVRYKLDETTKQLYYSRHKEYYQRTRDKHLNHKKEWYVENHSRLKECRLNRYNNDINFKLRSLLRCRLNAVIRGSKKGSAVRDLGCSIEELKLYLEPKFQDGMTWDNWGKYSWHVDHIVPLASFDLSDPEQLKKACHYTNLQPLWAYDNLSKGDKINLSFES